MSWNTANSGSRSPISFLFFLSWCNQDTFKVPVFCLAAFFMWTICLWGSENQQPIRRLAPADLLKAEFWTVSSCTTPEGLLDTVYAERSAMALYLRTLYLWGKAIKCSTGPDEAPETCWDKTQVCVDGLLWRKEGEKTSITLKECHVWEKLVKCGFICLSLETLLVPLTAFWCCHSLVFDVGRIRARPEWSSASLTHLVSNLEFFVECGSVPNMQNVFSAAKWGSQTFCILWLNMQPFQCNITRIWSSKNCFRICVGWF